MLQKTHKHTNRQNNHHHHRWLRNCFRITVIERKERSSQFELEKINDYSVDGFIANDLGQTDREMHPNTSTNRNRNSIRTEKKKKKNGRNKVKNRELFHNDQRKRKTLHETQLCTEKQCVSRIILRVSSRMLFPAKVISWQESCHWSTTTPVA